VTSPLLLARMRIGFPMMISFSIAFEMNYRDAWISRRSRPA
jgi:hypothetical protein